MAREKPDGPLVEYQAKCMLTLDGKMHPIVCRPSNTPIKALKPKILWLKKIKIVVIDEVNRASHIGKRDNGRVI